MKPSRYNLFVEDGDRVHAVNLLSRAAIDLSQEAYQAYCAFIAGKSGEQGAESSPHDELTEVMRSNLFILDDSFDELAYIRQRSEQERFGSRQLGMVIAPTMGCNFACHYCFESHTDSELSPDAQRRLVTLVRDRISDYDELAVQWFGGEPLRAMPVIESVSREMLELCALEGKGYAATVITNGYLMERSVSRRLADLGVREVQITLDGDRALHDRTRKEREGAGSFDRILENVRHVPEEVSVHVRVHLAPFNLESVLSLIDTLGGEEMAPHIDLLYFAPLFNYHVDMTSGQYEADGKRFATSEQFAELEIRVLERAQQWGFPLKDFLEVSYGICTAVRSNTLVVDSQGHLSKCYKDVGVPAESVGDLVQGVTDSPAVDRWLDVSIPRDDECRDCTFLPVCLGGCTKQWREGADKRVICTPLRYNHRDRVRLYFNA